MKNMIQADLYRLIKSKAFYFCIFFILFLAILGASTAQVISIGQGTESDLYSNASFIEKSSHMTKQEIYDLDTSGYRELVLSCEDYDFDKDYMGNNVNLYYAMIFMGVLIIASDFSNSCIKNTLSSAISRKKYFLSKFVFMALACCGIVFVSNYTFFAANHIFNGGVISSTFGAVTKMSLMQLPEAIAFSAILSAMAFVAKRTAIFNGISIPFVIVGQLLLSLAAFTLKIKEKYLVYELQTMMSKLIHDPSSAYLRNAYLVCAAIVAFCAAVGWAAFRKSEIK